MTFRVRRRESVTPRLTVYDVKVNGENEALFLIYDPQKDEWNYEKANNFLPV